MQKKMKWVMRSTVNRTVSIGATVALLALVSSLMSGCVQQTLQVSPATLSIHPPVENIHSAYVVMGEGGKASARVLTSAVQCPVIDIDGTSQAMRVRVLPATVAMRGDPASSKEAAFPVLTCEANLPAGAARASVGNIKLQVPRAVIHRIVLIADTGCRMKAADNAFQDCNDVEKWPFAQVAQSAAALKPDLVIHIGDIHYRESPCPPGNQGCAHSPWGYGYDTWAADLFIPARPLLMAAPWLFVRGNHESCARAGQGWFRFLDSNSWSEARSCNNPKLDTEGDFSDPFTVSVAADTQLIVFDSSKAGSKGYSARDEGYKKYVPQLLQVGALVKSGQHNFFLNHHPVLAFAIAKEADQVKSGNEALQSVMNLVYPKRLFPEGVDLVLNGHVHLFESLNFSSNHPSTVVVGNAGSGNEGSLPQPLPAGAQPAPGAVVENFSTRSEYGFATFDRVDGGWELTEWDVMGKAILRCSFQAGKMVCQKI